MKQDKQTTQKTQVKTYSVKEMAGLYEISKKTLNKWLTPFETEIGEDTSITRNKLELYLKSSVIRTRSI